MAATPRLEQKLEQIYYGKNPGALRGPAALFKEAKAQQVRGVTLKACKQFLKTQPTYTLYRPARRHYPRNHIIANYPGAVVQVHT